MPTPFETLVADPYARRRYLVEMDVWDSSTGSRTNRLLQSNSFSTSPWAAGAGGDATLSASGLTAPDGGTPTLFSDASAVAVMGRSQTVAITGSTGAYAVSFYLRAGTSSVCSIRASITSTAVVGEGVFQLTLSGSAAWRNAVTGTALSITALGDSWYRCTVVVTDTGAGTAVVVELRPAFASVFSAFPDNAATGTVHAYGGMLETGTVATSYIPTTTTAVSLVGDLRTKYYSTDGFNSGAGDTPAHTHYEPRVRTALTFTRALFSEGRIGGRSLPGAGVLTLANGDHGLDWLASANVDGRACRVLLGGDGFTRAQFGTIFDGTMAGLDFSPSTVDVRLRDWQEFLSRPLLENSFAGTGTWEGVASMAGQPKPKCLGKCRNIEPVLIDPANLRYMYHDGTRGGTRTLDAVYDRGVLLTAGSGYTNTASSGGFVLLAAPAGTITCDVTAPFLSAGALAEEIAITAGGLLMADLDTTAMAAFKALVPATVGFYARDQINCDDALDQIIGSVGGWWGFDRGGLFDLGRMDAPSVTSVATLTDVEILNFERVATRLPIWSLTLRYRRNWHPFSLTDLATQFQPGGISANNAKAFTDEWSTLAPSTDPLVKMTYLLAGSAETETLIDDSTAAAAERTRLFGLDSVGRDVYRVIAKTQPFQRELGDTIALVLDRYGLDAGRNFRIISMTEDSSSNRVELEVWG